MSVRCVLLAVAIVVLRINGAPTDTGYFLTSNLAVISNEAGLTASNTDNGGVSFAIGETAKSKTFAIGVQNDNFMFGVKVSEPVLQCYFTVTVTNPKTGYDTSTKIKLEVNEATGLAYLASPLPLKFFGSFEDNFAQFVVKSDGKMGLGPVVSSTKTVVFAAYNLARLYDAAHRFFLITLSWESLPALSEVVFGPDILFLTRKPSTGSSDESPDPESPKRGDQLSDTETTSAASETANASFWKSKWWIIVVCVIVVILLLAAAGVGGVLSYKKIKSRMTEKSKSKGQLGRTEDSDALSTVPSMTIQSVKPSGKENTEDTAFGNGSTNEQNTTKKSIITETTEQKDTTVEPDTTQTQKSVAKANIAPAAKQDPNYQTLAALSKAKKAPVLTTTKAAPKQNPNYQRPDGISNDSIMTSTKADKTPAAKTEKAPPKKPEANHQTVASSKDPKMSGDSTEDKTSAKKTDKTASKKPKRYFLKRTTGTDDYPESTVTDTKQISKVVPKVSSSKDPKSAADNDKVSSKKTGNAAPKKPKLYFMNRTTVTDDFPSTIVADKAPTAKTDK